MDILPQIAYMIIYQIMTLLRVLSDGAWSSD